MVIPLQPQQPQDIFELANRSVTGTRNTAASGFSTGALPSASGDGIRQAGIAGNREAVHARNIVKWFVPEVGIVDMYINPQSIDYQFKKHITNQRTKGGYVLQYWGEELTQLNIRGTTGSSGIEGINVLHDIYRAEQISFDPFALSLAADRFAENQGSSILGSGGSSVSDLVGGVIGEAGADILGLASNAIESGSVDATRTSPTLASLAFSVEMYYSGWVFRGYFNNFSVNERADRLGLFDYNTTFTVTQRRGLRQNFLGWHRSATSGPSNTDPLHGTPHTFEGVSSEIVTASGVANIAGTRGSADLLGDGLPLVNTSSTSIF